MDLRTIAEMTELCETLETAMKFLHERKENPRRKLKDFIEVDLHMVGKLRSEKVMIYKSFTSNYCIIIRLLIIAAWNMLFLCGGLQMLSVLK